MARPKIYSHNEEFFASFTNESCYMAGVLAGDGNIDLSRNTVRLYLKHDDVDLILKFKDILQTNNPIRNSPLNNLKGTEIHSATKIIHDLSENFHITANKTFTLQSPSLLLKNHTQHYIRGILDSDGFIMKKDTSSWCIGFCGTQSLMEWISINIHKYVPQAGQANIKPSKNIFYIQYSGYQVRHILDWLYENSIDQIRLNRKYNLYQELLKFYQNKPKFRGVHWDKKKAKWQATLWHHNKNDWLGYFDDPNKAAIAYDLKAIEILGSKAKLNFAMESYCHSY